MTTAVKRSPVSQAVRIRRRNTNLAGYTFILPWLIGLIMFTSVPMLYSLYLSFTKYDVLGAPQWIGVNNYVNMVQDDTFWKALGVTFKYVFLLVPLRLASALGVALVLTQNHKAISLYRTVYYVPSLLGGSVAIAIVWARMFGSNGAFNGIISAISGTVFSFNWVGEISTALYSLILLGCWHF